MGDAVRSPTTRQGAEALRCRTPATALPRGEFCNPQCARFCIIILDLLVVLLAFLSRQSVTQSSPTLTCRDAAHPEMVAPERLGILQMHRAFPVFVDNDLAPVMIYEWDPPTAPAPPAPHLNQGFLERTRAQLHTSQPMATVSASRTVSDVSTVSDSRTVSNGNTGGASPRSRDGDSPEPARKRVCLHPSAGSG